MNCLKALIFPALGVALTSACEPANRTPVPEPSGTPQIEDSRSERPDVKDVTNPVPASGGALPEKMDCVREAGGLLIAAHRGGPAPDYPENAIETLQHGYDAGIRVFEIDVAESEDGQLFLMHDRSLGRTTTGSGAVADTTWAKLSKLDLVDNEGRVTGYAIPSLQDTLAWAVSTNAILELDRKETTSFRNIIEAVRAAKATNNVILITYNDDEALQVASLAPEMMMTAGIGGKDHEAKMIDAGLDPEMLIAWTGTERPNPGKWRALAAKGIESAFGTLGRENERLDDIYWADDDPSEYEELVEAGLVLLATDEPYRLVEAKGLVGDAIESANETCLKD